MNWRNRIAAPSSLAAEHSISRCGMTVTETSLDQIGLPWRLKDQAEYAATAGTDLRFDYGPGRCQQSILERGSHQVPPEVSVGMMIWQGRLVRSRNYRDLLQFSGIEHVNQHRAPPVALE